MLPTRSPEGSPQPAATPPSPRLILVVDDEPLILEVLALVLQSEGYDVVTRDNGAAALEWLSGHLADLVLLDFMMPGMDGAAVGRSIRAQEHSRGVGLVISSALPERTVRERFAGYDAYLQKPFEMQRLLDTISRLLASVSPR